MTPVDLFRAQRPAAVDAARDAAQERYAADFDRLVAANEARAAMIALTACRAETKTAPSPDPSPCDCQTCSAWMFGVRWARLTGSAT